MIFAYDFQNFLSIQKSVFITSSNYASTRTFFFLRRPVVMMYTPITNPIISVIVSGAIIQSAPIKRIHLLNLFSGATIYPEIDPARRYVPKNKITVALAISAGVPINRSSGL